MEQLEVQASSLRYLTDASPPDRAGDSSILPPLAFPSINAGASTASTPSFFGSTSPGMQATPGGRHAQAGASQSPAATGASAKRRANDDDDNSAKQQRSKRNRYISIACNECKRRKIKCNGETPCKRCGNLNLACLYTPNCCGSSFKDSDEYKQMVDKMLRMEGLVESLAQTVGTLRQEAQRLAPLHDRLLHVPPSSAASLSPASTIPSLHRPEMTVLRPLQHTFRGGPMSTAFTVDVAKNTLHNMGYDNDAHDAHDDPVLSAIEATPNTSPLVPTRLPSMAWQPPRPQPLDQQAQPPQQQTLQQEQPPPPPQREGARPRDPLWDFDRDEMIRLCRVHQEEVGIMYPVVPIEQVIEHAHYLATAAPRYDEAVLSAIPTLLVKIVLCCALAVEEHGNSERATRLYESMQPIIDRMLMSAPSDIRNLPFLALAAGYRFLTNDEVLAWRVMGQVVRHCLEQGLHRREGVAAIADEQDRQSVVNTFWTAYILDRRWSFGTGLPYVVQDDKLDPHLPMPDSPYSVAMITYSRLSAKIWRLVDFFEPAIVRDELQREAFEALDQEVLQWYASCPAQVRVSDLRRLPTTKSYDLQRQQIWTRLRLNQMRIWLLTPVLHSASSINKNMDLAQKVVDLAKETIHYLSDLYTGSDLYARIQVFYHQFLTSAIAVLFLASTHQPVQFSTLCRDEFYMALDLVKDMSAKSWVSQRLWRTIRQLKAYAPRLGLQKEQQQQQQQQQRQTEENRGTVEAGDDRSHDYRHRHRSTVLPPPPPPPPPPIPSSRRTNNDPAAVSTAPSPGGAPSFGQLLDPPPAPFYPPPSSSLSLPVSPGGTVVAASTPAAPPPPEKPNGVQLQSELTLIFENLLGLNSGGPRFGDGGSSGSDSGGSSSHQPPPLTSSSPSVAAGDRFGQDGGPWHEGAARMADSASVFEQVKNLF